MINRVLDMQNLTVRQVCRPLAEVLTIGRDRPLREALALARERNLTRLPVRDPADPARRIIGVLSLRSLLYDEGVNPDRVVGEFVTPALYLDGELRAEAALRRMQKSGQRLAIVLGLDKKETGIVTVQDILRHAFGEVTL
jgi:CBS domain containing-hemolysin-like protein